MYMISESSWDVECAELVGIQVTKSFVHNDFFKTSNRENTKLSKRILVFFKVTWVSLKLLVHRKELSYSSFNIEVVVPALVFSFYKKNKIFVPNVLANPDTYVGLRRYLYRLLFRLYAKRIIVSDVVTKSELSEFNPILAKYFFRFELPKEITPGKTMFLFSLPAVTSHYATKDNASKVLSHIAQVIDCVSKHGCDIYLLLHPREEELGIFKITEKYKEKIISSDVVMQIEPSDLVIISGYSSLSLNKRYGGRYGAWVSVNGDDGLPPHLEHFQKYLYDLESLMEKVR